MFVFQSDKLVPREYTNLDLQYDKDSHQFTFVFFFFFFFTLGDAVVGWTSLKQSCIVDSTMKVKYVSTFEVAKEVV